MSLDLRSLPPEVNTVTSERHLATLTVLRPDGSPHVTPVGFSWDAEAGLVRIITFAGAHKVRHLTRRPHPRAAVCQVDGGRWLTFEGPASVTADPARVAQAIDGYAARYRPPSERPDRVAIEIAVDRVTGRP
jgi:PPOX class probable F420-dependent enzyme